MSRSARFENVEPGQYVVLAKGSMPSQRAGQRLDVAGWDMPPVHVQIMPFALHLRTVSNDGPLIDSRIILRQHEAFWEVPIDTVDGKVTVDLWQAGTLSATVESRGTARGSRTSSDAEGRMTLTHMPAGMYEFWPAPRGTSGPVRMNVAPGENVVTLTFTPTR
jgi:hypothetical protein